MNQRYFIGVDVSKQKLDICVVNTLMEIVVEKEVKNTIAGIVNLLRSIKRKLRVENEQILVCCENTGIYGRPLEKSCVASGIDLWVENAVKIKRASTDFRGKTDRKDAHRIACYAVRYQDQKRLYTPPSEMKQKLETLLHARESLIKNLNSLKVQLHQAKSHAPEQYRILANCYKPAIKTIQQQIARIEKQVDEIGAADPAVERNIKLLTSIPGIGKQNALQFIIHTDNFTRFDSAKHLACYAGVVPFPHQSGTTTKRERISRHANQLLKRLLHMAAMAAIRSNSDLRAYFIRKVAQGKNKMSVLNAIRNKLVQRMFAVIKRQNPYLPYLPEVSIS